MQKDLIPSVFADDSAPPVESSERMATAATASTSRATAGELLANTDNNVQRNTSVDATRQSQPPPTKITNINQTAGLRDNSTVTTETGMSSETELGNISDANVTRASATNFKKPTNAKDYSTPSSNTNERVNMMKSYERAWPFKRSVAQGSSGTFPDGRSFSAMSSVSRQKLAYGNQIDNDCHSDHYGYSDDDGSSTYDQDNSTISKALSPTVTVPTDEIGGRSRSSSRRQIIQTEYDQESDSSASLKSADLERGSHTTKSYSSRKTGSVSEIDLHYNVSDTHSDLSQDHEPPQERSAPVITTPNDVRPKRHRINLPQWASQRSMPSRDSSGVLKNISLMRSLRNMKVDDSIDLDEKSMKSAGSQMSSSYGMRSVDGMRGNPDDSGSVFSGPLGLQLVDAKCRFANQSLNVDANDDQAQAQGRTHAPTPPVPNNSGYIIGPRLYERDSSSRFSVPNRPVYRDPSRRSIPEEREYQYENNDPYDPYYAIVATPIAEEESASEDSTKKLSRRSPFQDKRIVCFIIMAVFTIVGLGAGFIMQTQEMKQINNNANQSQQQPETVQPPEQGNGGTVGCIPRNSKLSTVQDQNIKFCDEEEEVQEQEEEPENEVVGDDGDDTDETVTLRPDTGASSDPGPTTDPQIPSSIDSEDSSDGNIYLSMLSQDSKDDDVEEESSPLAPLAPNPSSVLPPPEEPAGDPTGPTVLPPPEEPDGGPTILPPPNAPSPGRESYVPTTSPRVDHVCPNCMPGADDDGDSGIFNLFHGALSTGIVAHEGQRKLSQGCMFNVFSKDNHLMLTSIDFLLASTDDYKVFIFTKAGSYVGFENAKDVWEQVLVEPVVVQGQGPETYTHVKQEFFSNIPIMRDQTRAFYVYVKPKDENSQREVMISSMGQREGDIVVSNTKMALMEGVCLRANFKYDESHEPAKFHGRIGYRQKLFPF